MLSGRRRRITRRAFAGLALAALLLPVACCRRRPPPETPPPVLRAGLALEEGAPRWWTERARHGLDRVAAVLSADPLDLGEVPLADARGAVRALGEQRAMIAFLVGESWSPLVYTESVAFPATRYVVIGGDVVGERAVGVTFLRDEAAFLAGVLAATTSEGGPCVLAGDGRQAADEALEEAFLRGFRRTRRGPETLRVAAPSDLVEAAASGVGVVFVSSVSPDPAVLEAAARAGVGLVVTDPGLITVGHPEVIAAISVDLGEAMLRVARETGESHRMSYVFDLSSGVVDLVVAEPFIEHSGSGLIEALATARAEITAGITEVERLGF